MRFALAELLTTGIAVSLGGPILKRRHVAAGPIRALTVAVLIWSTLAATTAVHSLTRGLLFFWISAAGAVIQYAVIRRVAPESLTEGPEWFEKHKLLPFAIVLPGVVIAGIAFMVRG